MGKRFETFKANWKAFASGGWDGVQPDFWAPDSPLSRRSAVWGDSGMFGDREQIENDFVAYVAGAYKANGPVFSCITARQMVFSEAVLQFRSKVDGKLYGNPSLKILETPWPGGTTGELLSRMEQDASLAGNSFHTRADDKGRLGNAAKGKPGERIAHLRPDWVTIVIGSSSGDPRAADAKPLGIIYGPAVAGQGGIPADGTFLMMDEISHYSPIPDPIARFRGMSWLTPILREVEGDKGMVRHKNNFLDNAAVPNLAVSVDKDTNKDDFEQFVKDFGGKHAGQWNAYKTLFLMGGADVTALSHDFKQLDFANVIGKGESRIASAAGVPASWVGFSEGMQGSALNSGNMAANRRRFADGTIRPLWRIAVASLAPLLDIKPDSELWWDETGIAFLREDQTDRADIMRIDMNAIDAGIKAGYKPDACIDAVFSNDIRKLIGQHTGLVSVQMQPPVDPDNKVEETQGQARIEQTLALTLQSYLSAGATFESAVAAVDKNDITLLKKAPPEDWSPSGQPLRNPPAGSLEDPTGTPTGGPAPGAPGSTPTGAPTGAKPPAPAPAAQPPKPAAAAPVQPQGGGK